MAVTFSKGGITYSDGKIQRFAGIGAKSYSGYYWEPFWSDRTSSRSPNTIYYPNSGTSSGNRESASFISLTCQVGLNSSVKLWLRQTPAGIFSYDDYLQGIAQWESFDRGSPIKTLTMLIPPSLYYRWYYEVSGANASVSRIVEWRIRN